MRTYEIGFLNRMEYLKGWCSSLSDHKRTLDFCSGLMTFKMNLRILKVVQRLDVYLRKLIIKA